MVHARTFYKSWLLSVDCIRLQEGQQKQTHTERAIFLLQGQSVLDWEYGGNLPNFFGQNLMTLKIVNNNFRQKVELMVLMLI